MQVTFTLIVWAEHSSKNMCYNSEFSIFPVFPRLKHAWDLIQQPSPEWRMVKFTGVAISKF